MIAVVFLQPECNMYCRFCVTQDDFEVMPAPVAAGLMERLRDRGVRTVVLGGGEPFAWRGDVLRLATRAKELGLCVQVGTNGIALPPGFAELACIDRYVLPLESVDAGVHDDLRRFGGQHHRIVLERLRELQRAGKSVTVSTVVTRANRMGLPALAHFLEGYQSVSGNLHAWHLYQLLPQGRGGAKHGPALQVSVEDYQAACAEVQAMNLPFTVYRRVDMYRSRTVEFFWYQDRRVVAGSEAWPARITGS